MAGDKLPPIQVLDRPEDLKKLLKEDRGDDCLGCKIIGELSCISYTVMLWESDANFSLLERLWGILWPRWLHILVWTEAAYTPTKEDSC